MTEPGKVSSRRLHTGRVINLDVDTVRFPDGSIGELEMIRHPGAAAVIPVMALESDDPEVVLIRQYRYATDGYIHEIPAGRLEKDEAPIDCARRELLEEIGATAERYEPLYSMFTTPGFTDERIHVFLATGLRFAEAAPEHDEFITTVRVTLSGALQLLEKGQLPDAKSAVALLYLDRKIRTR